VLTFALGVALLVSARRAATFEQPRLALGLAFAGIAIILASIIPMTGLLGRETGET
jgi:hypothetical protein